MFALSCIKKIINPREKGEGKLSLREELNRRNIYMKKLSECTESSLVLAVIQKCLSFRYSTKEYLLGRY